jgi:molybdopterin converting factor small subunit
VRLFFHLRRHAPLGAGSEFVLRLPPKADVGAAMAALKMEPLPVKVILVNGRQASVDDALGDDDLLVIFPPVEGG